MKLNNFVLIALIIPFLGFSQRYRYTNTLFPSSTITQNVNKVLADTKAVTVLIKTDDQATYRNAIDMLDELKICDVGKRVIGVEMTQKEFELLQQKIK